MTPFEFRDNDLETFWQSDGDQPHFINVQFHKKVIIEVFLSCVSAFVDYCYFNLILLLERLSAFL